MELAQSYSEDARTHFTWIEIFLRKKELMLEKNYKNTGEDKINEVGPIVDELG